MRRQTAWLLATWFGCGKWPWGPGTAGSIGALLPLLPLLGVEGDAWRWTVLALIAVFLVPGIWAAGAHAAYRGRKDPQDVVIDEVLGQWVTLAFAPSLTWGSLGIAFVLFRLFDITKPAPVRQAEAFPSGTGIVADDLVAGLYGGLVFSLLGWFNLYG